MGLIQKKSLQKQTAFLHKQPNLHTYNLPVMICSENSFSKERM